MYQPSPPDKKSFWHRTPTSTTTSSHRSALSENEPFSISRESFESYRRSFVRTINIPLESKILTIIFRISQLAPQSLIQRLPPPDKASTQEAPVRPDPPLTAQGDLSAHNQPTKKDLKKLGSMMMSNPKEGASSPALSIPPILRQVKIPRGQAPVTNSIFQAGNGVKADRVQS